MWPVACLICNSLECWKNKKFSSDISSFHTRNPTSKYLFSSHRGMNQEIDIQHFIFGKKNVPFFRKDFIIWTFFSNLYRFDCAILFIISTHSASTSVYKTIMNELHTYLDIYMRWNTTFVERDDLKDQTKKCRKSLSICWDLHFKNHKMVGKN